MHACGRQACNGGAMTQLKQFAIYAGVAVVCALAGGAGGAQSQEPAVPPKSIFGVYGSSGRGRARAGRDSIRIMSTRIKSSLTSQPDAQVNFTLKLYYANGHTCQLDKDASWESDRLVVMAEGLEPNQPCRLEAYFTPGRIRLSDEGQRCAQVYCGTRGKLDGVVFSKTRR